MKKSDIYSLTGRQLDELTLEAVVQGRLTQEDFRISGDMLRTQADTAEMAGFPQVAENLQRAAELSAIPNEDVLDIYKALRPGRTSYQRLIELAVRLETELSAPLTAKLVREAAEAYRMRGVVPRTTNE